MPEFVQFSQLALVNPPLTVEVPAPNQPVSFIPMADVSDTGEWTTRQIRRLRDIGAGYTPFQENDVLFAKITPCMENGKGCHACGLLNGVGFGSTEFHVLRARGETSPRFIYHWSRFEPLRKKALAAMSGSAGQQRVEAAFFDRFTIPDLPPQEQPRIAGILDTLDSVICETEEVVAKLRQVKAGLLHDLLTRGLDEHGQLRDPDRHPEQFHDSPVGRIPSEWLASELEQFVPSAEYGISNALNDAGPTPILRMNNLSDGEVDLSDLKFTHARVPDHLLLCPADVLFNRTNSMEHVGRTGIWRGQLPYAGFASYLVRLNPHPKRMLSELLNLILNRPENQLAMRRFATPGVHQVNINPTNLKRLLVAAPKSLDEQARIIERLGRADECINGEERELSKLHSLKRGLAHDLLTGRVRVKVGGGA